MRKFVVITRWDDIPLVFDIPIMVRLLGRSYDSVKKMCLQVRSPLLSLGMNGALTSELSRDG